MKKSAYFGWTIGSFTSSALVSAVGLLHLRFMTDSLGIAITIAGLLTVVAKVYDAFADLLMGYISDRTRTRFGQFRPYLLAGGLLAALSMALLFNVPGSLTGSALWLYVGLTLLIYSTAYTMFRIPYLAIGRTLTDDFHARSRLMTFSVYGSSLGSFAATSAAPFLLGQIGSDRAGHGLVAMILAGAIALGGIVAFTLLKEQHVVEREERKPAASFGATFAALRSNRPFLCLMGFKLVLFAGFAVHISAIPYYTRHVLGVSDSVLGTIFAVQTALMVLSQMAWVRLAARYGRRNALVLSGIACTLAYITWALIPSEAAIPMVFVAAAMSGAGTGGIFLGLYTVLTDTMDYSRRTQGENRAGMLAGVFVMVEKGTSALGTFAFSMIMAWVGFQSAVGSGAQAQPDGVRTGILASVAIVPALGAVIATLIMTRYHLPAQATQDAGKVRTPEPLST